MPEEIFHAAGLYPVRIFGGKGDTTRADAYLYSNICSFARSCLEEGFQEYGKLLDGFVAVNSCDHIRRLYDIWKGYLPAPFTHILSLPHKVSESAIAFFTKQLLRLKEGLEEADYLRTIEDLGGLVVTDDLCNGTRYFWDRVDEERDPLEALARRYLAKAPCARMRPSHERMAFIRELIQEFRVDGVVYETLKFCDLYGEDYPILKENLDELQAPVVALDREHRSAGVGQTKTRVQAFLEKLGG